MKHLASLFLLSFLLCCSCSQQMDDEWKPNEQLPNVPETHPVGVSFSRASLETFAEYGITEVGVYVYLQLIFACRQVDVASGTVIICFIPFFF